MSKIPALLRTFAKLMYGVALAVPLSAWATPREDARLIAEREFVAQWREQADLMLRKALMESYFRPISGQGIRIADEQAFFALIPDHEIAPFYDRLTDRIAASYLRILSPEELAMFSAVLRADEGLTLSEISVAARERKVDVLLSEAREQMPVSGSDDPNVLALEETAVHLRAFNAFLEDGGAEQLGRSVALGLAPLFAIHGYTREIDAIVREDNDPVTIAAIRAEGVLQFANPVQRTTLLRQLEGTGGGSGIRFIRPPSTDTAELD